MYKKFILTSTFVGFMALSVAPVFAATTSGTTMAPAPVVKPVVFKPTTDSSTKIACVGGAVNTREQAIGAAMTTFTSASNAAYATRAAALKQAYTGTTYKEVSAAVKAAWTAFSTSQKSARKTWQMSRDDAWKSYRTVAVACKAPGGTGDGVNSTSETGGN